MEGPSLNLGVLYCMPLTIDEFADMEVFREINTAFRHQGEDFIRGVLTKELQVYAEKFSGGVCSCENAEDCNSIKLSVLLNNKVLDF